MGREQSKSEAKLPLPRTIENPDSGGEELDDLDRYLADELADPRFNGAFEDAGVREALLQALLAARHSVQLTQASVAETMGTTQSAVSELEGGLSDPRLSTLQRYARAVGCRIAAWVVATGSSGDDVVQAFVGSEGSYLTGLSHRAPYSTLTVVNGQPLNLQITGITLQQFPAPALVLLARIEAGEEISAFPTFSISDRAQPAISSGEEEAPSDNPGEYIRILAGSVTP